LSVGNFKLFYDCKRQKELASSTKRTLKGADIHHGDMIYLHATQSTDDHMDVDTGKDKYNL